MTQNISTSCIICCETTTEPLNPLPYTDHTLTHIFHRSCVQRWVEVAGTSCPLCRHQIVDLQFLGRQALPEQQALRFAAQNDNQEALQRLIRTDLHRAIAIAHLPEDSAHFEAVLNEAANKPQVQKQAIQIAAYEPNFTALRRLIQTDEHRAIAMATHSLQKELLRSFLMEQAENAGKMRQMAVAIAAESNDFKLMNELIQTEEERIIALASLPLSNWRLIDRLLHNCDNADAIRHQAAILALDSNPDILRFLIRDNSDRALIITLLKRGDDAKLAKVLEGIPDPFEIYKIAFAELAEDEVDLIEFVIEKAPNPQRARLAAIEAAAKNSDLSLLEKLIQKKEHRAYAIGSLPEEGIDLISPLMNDEVAEIAVMEAATQKNLPVLTEIVNTDEQRAIAVVFLPENLRSERLEFFENAFCKVRVKNIAFHIAAKIKLFGVLNQLIENRQEYQQVLLLLDPSDQDKIEPPLERLRRQALELNAPAAKRERKE